MLTQRLILHDRQHQPLCHFKPVGMHRHFATPLQSRFPLPPGEGDKSKPWHDSATL
jgi:hypothetical protein